MEKRIALEISRVNRLNGFLYVKYGLYTPSLKIKRGETFIVTRL